MATKKDLVEAYSFSRRRLVTAFVSGAPGGREVEPSRPGRTVIGGLALGVLLLAGAAILGVFKPGSTFDPAQAALLAGPHGVLYVNLPAADDAAAVDTTGDAKRSPTLHPVINSTSAMLILGTDEPGKLTDKDLTKYGKAGPIGILQAPATVPEPSDLVQSGWTACTASGHGVRAKIGASATVPFSGAVLIHDSAYHVLATNAAGEAHVYDVDQARLGPLETALHLNKSAVQVSAKWTALFPQGTPLTAQGLGIGTIGSPLPTSAIGQAALNGDLFDASGETLVATKDGFASATPFAKAVLSAENARPRGAAPANYPQPTEPFDPDWPTAVPTTTLVGAQVCAVLRPGSGGATSVSLATAADPGVNGSELPAGAIDAAVDPGKGAVVQSVAGTPTSGTPYLIDDRAFAYRIASTGDLGRLGYAKVAQVLVSPSWIALFHPGVELSRAAALCPPTVSGGKACS
ncbi:type VII secretion protein EccB [Nocardioides montaniterrae]